MSDADLQIIEFIRDPSLGYRIDYRAVLSDGREVPFTIYTEQPRKSQHDKRQYFVGRIRNEQGKSIFFKFLAFNEERFTYGIGSMARYTCWLLPWLLDGRKERTENYVMFEI